MVKKPSHATFPLTEVKTMPFFKLKGLIIDGSFQKHYCFQAQNHLSKGPKSPYEPKGQTRPLTEPSVCSETHSEITYRSNTQRVRTKLNSVHILGLPEAQNEVPRRSRGR
jgi:hypothetical protein